MTTMNIAEAKSKLSELVARAEAGEDVTISRNGKPAVRLVPTEAAVKPPRRIGVWDHLGLRIDEKIFLTPDRELEDLMDAPLVSKPVTNDTL